MKYDDAPYRRWTPKPNWLLVHFHPPERCQLLQVRRGEDGPPFKATYYGGDRWLDESGQVVKPGQLYWLSPV
jgi:hypothetical protein